MSDTKWTPGPWFADGHIVIVDSRHMVCCGRGRNGECCGNPDVGGDYGEIAQTSPNNAHLISAAPDMAEALEKLIAGCDSAIADPDCMWPAEDWPPLKEARAALAKARGTT